MAALIFSPIGIHVRLTQPNEFILLFFFDCSVQQRAVEDGSWPAANTQKRRRESMTNASGRAEDYHRSHFFFIPEKNACCKKKKSSVLTGIAPIKSLEFPHSA